MPIPRQTTFDEVGDLSANGLARQDGRDVCLSGAECLAVPAHFRHADDEIAVVFALATFNLATATVGDAHDPLLVQTSVRDVNGIAR